MGIHEVMPGILEVYPVLVSGEGALGQAGIKVMVKSNEVDIVQCAHFTAPGPVCHRRICPEHCLITPSNKADIGVSSAHFFSKAGCDLPALVGCEAKGTAVGVRCLVADLPVFYVVGCFYAVETAERVLWVIAVSYPFGGLFIGTYTAVAKLVILPGMVAFRLHIHHQQGLGLYSAAEVYKFMGAYLIVVHAAPADIVHGNSVLLGTNGFFPVVVGGKAAAPANHSGGEFTGLINDLFMPVVLLKIPGSVYRGVTDAQGLHELHIEIGGYLVFTILLDF